MSTTPDPVRWVASSYSGNGGGNCVEWAPEVFAASGRVPVRDSKAPEGPVLVFPAEQWTSFVEHLSA